MIASSPSLGVGRNAVILYTNQSFRRRGSPLGLHPPPSSTDHRTRYWFILTHYIAYTIYNIIYIFISLRPRIILCYYYFFFYKTHKTTSLGTAQTLVLVHSTAINLSLSGSVARVIRSFNLSSQVRRQTTTTSTTTTTTTTTLASPSSVVKWNIEFLGVG